MNVQNKANAKKFVEFFKGLGYPDNFIVGLGGNICSESAHTFEPNITQKSFKLNDNTYTANADNNKQTYNGQMFVTDKVGYGLCQWTSSGRKTGLLEYAKSKGKSVGDLQIQLEWIDKEIHSTGYATCRKAIKENWSIEECARIICTEFERPAKKDDPTVQQNRINYAKEFYTEFLNPNVGKEENNMAKIKLMFDEGHDNKRNQSPVVPSYYESVAMWKLGHYCADILNATGLFQVDHTRPTLETFKDVVDRGLMGKGYKGFYSFHSNASGTESVDRPVGIYLATDDTTTIDEESKEIARLMTDVIKSVMGTSQNPQIYEKIAGYDRNGNGITTDDDYYGVLYGAHKVGTPAVILEHSFHTNTKSAKWLNNDANLKKMAQAEADAIIKYYGVSASTKPVEQKPVEIPTQTYTATKYVVKSGDTLGAIAKRFNTSVDEIMSLNPSITNPNKIYPKQEIIVDVNGADFFQSLKIGDLVRLKDNSTYYNGKAIPNWVKKSKLYYRGENKNGAIVSILKIGAITGTVKKENLLPY